MKVLDAASASLLKPESSPDCPPGWVSGYGSCGEIGAKEPVDSLLIVNRDFSFEGAGNFSLCKVHATSIVEKLGWG
jgi:hypothetical protein